MERHRNAKQEKSSEKESNVWGFRRREGSHAAPVSEGENVTLPGGGGVGSWGRGVMPGLPQRGSKPKGSPEEAKVSITGSSLLLKKITFSRTSFNSSSRRTGFGDGSCFIGHLWKAEAWGAGWEPPGHANSRSVEGSVGIPGTCDSKTFRGTGACLYQCPGATVRKGHKLGTTGFKVLEACRPVSRCHRPKLPLEVLGKEFFQASSQVSGNFLG